MRGAGSSHVSLCADSRYHWPTTYPSARRTVKIAHFHAAGWAPGPCWFMVMVEAVGIEPTSGNPQPQASTSIAGLSYGSLVP